MTITKTNIDSAYFKKTNYNLSYGPNSIQVTSTLNST